MKTQHIITALIIGTSIFHSSYANTKSLVKSKPHNHIELLFFQQANSGAIHPASSGCYNLILSEAHKEVLYFANSPSKIAGTLTLNQFAETITHSQQVEKIKPNAILNAKLLGKQTTLNLIGSLSNASYNNKKFHYTFCPFESNQVIKRGEIRHINLFVDPIHRWPP